MISVDRVCKAYQASNGDVVKALSGVSFRCEAGRVFALLGPNGSGKTTLLRIISTLMTADEGQVLVGGMDVREHARDVRRQLGFLTGTAGLHDKLSPVETLEFFGGLQGMRGTRLKMRMAELMEWLEIGDFSTRPCGKLSMGQKQRVMIARTLLHDPTVVVFDEATTGLDVLAAQSLIGMIRQCRDQGKTVLFSTHIMGEVAMLADDLTILHEGRQVFLGGLDELKSGQQAGSLEDEFVRLLGGEVR